MSRCTQEFNRNTLFLFHAVFPKPEQSEPFELVDSKLSSQLETLNVESSLDDRIHALAVDYGVVVHESALHAFDFIESYMHETRTPLRDALDATFYSNWQDLTSRTQAQLFIDKIIHWILQYNPEHPLHRPDKPEKMDASEVPKDLVKNLLVVTSISEQAAQEKALKLIQDARPLSDQVLENAIDLLDYVDLDWTSVFDTIKNREARVRTFSKIDLESLAPHEFVRFLVFKYTGESLLIKNKELIKLIIDSKADISADCLEYSVNELSSVYNRFKPILLAFKHANKETNAATINRLAKLSKLHHRPLTRNPLLMVTTRRLEQKDMHWFRKSSTSALMRALNVCKLASTPQNAFRYVIRNGKVWTTERERSEGSIEAARYNFTILHDIVRDRFVNADFDFTTRYFIPPDIQYGLPISDKDLVGAIPQMTRVIKNNEDLVLGVTWGKESNVRVLDLSAISEDGNKVGWNKTPKFGSVLHSGDLMAFNSGGLATELLQFSDVTDPEEERDWMVYMNSWDGSNNFTFDVLVGKASPPQGDGEETDIKEKSKQTHEYMLDPANILLTAYKYNSKKYECLFGMVRRRIGRTELIIAPRHNNSRRTSAFGTRDNVMMKALDHEMEHSISFNEFLTEVLGCEIVDNKEDADVDLSPELLTPTSFSSFIV